MWGWWLVAGRVVILPATCTAGSPHRLAASGAPLPTQASQPHLLLTCLPTYLPTHPTYPQTQDDITLEPRFNLGTESLSAGVTYKVDDENKLRAIFDMGSNEVRWAGDSGGHQAYPVAGRPAGGRDLSCLPASYAQLQPTTNRGTPPTRTGHPDLDQQRQPGRRRRDQADRAHEAGQGQHAADAHPHALQGGLGWCLPWGLRLVCWFVGWMQPCRGAGEAEGRMFAAKRP